MSERKPRLNLELVEKVAALTKAGVSQKEIGSRLGICRSSTYRFQKEAGLHAWSTIPSKAKERKILALLVSGMARKDVEKGTNSTVHVVRRIAEAHRTPRHAFVHRPKRIPAGVLSKLTQDILNRRDHAAELSRKYGVSYERVLQLAHAVLGCEQLRTGRMREPLSSPFPQKWPSWKAGMK